MGSNELLREDAGHPLVNIADALDKQRHLSLVNVHSIPVPAALNRVP